MSDARPGQYSPFRSRWVVISDDQHHTTYAMAIPSGVLIRHDTWPGHIEGWEEGIATAICYVPDLDLPALMQYLKGPG